MITQFRDYNISQIDYDAQEKIISEYIGTFERKILILENYWNPDLFNRQSTKPFFEQIGNLINEDVMVGHRYIDSKQGLAYYMHYPDGLIWKNVDTYGVSAFMFETHGSSIGLELPLNKVTKQDLLNNCNGFGEFPNILYFGSCGIFNGIEGEKFGWELLHSSGSRAVFGFSSKQLSFTTGTLVSLIFLSTFFKFKDDPFCNLREIYESVIHDFPLAASDDVGFTMFYDE